MRGAGYRLRVPADASATVIRAALSALVANPLVSGSPVVYKDSIYCGSADGVFYCLEYRTGRLRWKFSTGGAITGAPVINNDIVYIGSTDHKIYALPA